MSYELRTYVANPGKFDALLSRFRDHTDKLFAKHGMESLGYWLSDKEPNTLIYVLKHKGDSEANWKAFIGDPDWISARDASEIDGPLVASIESQFMGATDFSKLL
jgi:hypothetical protein